jgi:hypothetical protein
MRCSNYKSFINQNTTTCMWQIQIWSCITNTNNPWPTKNKLFFENFSSLEIIFKNNIRIWIRFITINNTCIRHKRHIMLNTAIYLKLDIKIKLTQDCKKFKYPMIKYYTKKKRSYVKLLSYLC